MSFSVETGYALLAMVSAITGITLFACWRQDRSDIVTLVWCAAVAAAGIGQAAIVATFRAVPGVEYVTALSVAAVYPLIFAATLMTFKRRVPIAGLIVFGVALFLITIVGRQFGVTYGWSDVLVTVVVTASLVGAGAVFLRTPTDVYGISGRVFGALLIMQGAVRASVPYFQTDPAVGPWAGLIQVTVYFSLMTALIVLPLSRRHSATKRLSEALAEENASRRRAQQRFEDMVETGFDFVWERDAERRMTYVSRRLEEITGFAAARVLGKTSEEVRESAGQTPDPSWEDLRHALDARRSFHDVRCISINPMTGKRQILSFSGKPIFNEQGDFIGNRGVCRDMTESVEARNLVTAVLEGVGNRIGRDYLQGMVDYLGRSLEMDLVFVGEVSRDRQGITARAVFDDKPSGFEFEFGLSGTPSADVAAGRQLVIPKDVTALYPEARSLRSAGASGYIGAPLVDGAGNVLGVLVLIRRGALENTDIAKTVVSAIAPRAAAELGRHVAEGRSRHHERLLKAVLDNMPVGVSIRDSSGRYVMANRALGRLYDFDESSLIGRDIRYFQEAVGAEPQNIDRAITDTSVVQRTGGSVVQEITKTRADGKTQNLVLTRFQIPDELGNPTMVGTAIVDMTTQKRMERSLRQSQKMDAVGQLAAGIAHDFNNILGAIMGYAKFISDDALPGNDTGKYADRILTASRRAKDLIQQLLAFSRRSDSPRRVCRVSDLIRESAELLRPILPATTSLDISDHAPKALVLADSSQIGQVLLNVCVNGSDALSGRPGTLKVEIQQRPMGEWSTTRDGVDIAETADGGYRMTVGRPEHDGALVVIRISDSGVGMDRGVLERLFEPFFTTKPQGKGSGLGLPVAQGIVLEHGGALIVTTRPDRGTTIEICLPAAQASEPDMAPSENSAPTPVRSQRKRRILVVDDDVDFGDMMAIALERVGYEVAICQDPKEAIEIFAEDPAVWDVVVTDQTMPGMTGTQVVAAVKAYRADIGCVLLTGYGGQSTEEAARQAGADAFASKPIDPSVLSQIIARLLRTPEPAA